MRISAETSVALCTFNGEKFIEKQLRSILAQTILPAQIVLSDDGSSDNTVKLVNAVVESEKLAQPDINLVDIRILRNKSALGVTKNFEQAIAHCSGELVVLCDQDDVWEPNRIEVLLAEFANGSDLVFGDATLIDEFGKKLPKTLFESLGVTSQELKEISGSAPYKVLSKRNIVTGATCGFRKSILESAFPFPNHWVHDEWIAMVAAFTGHTFSVTPALIGYRQHNDNQIGVSQVGLRQKIARVREKGKDRNLRLLDRALELAGWAREHISQEDLSFLIAEKVRHEEARNRFHQNRFRRLPEVFAEIRTGRYRTSGMGAQDILRDIFQPL